MVKCTLMMTPIPLLPRRSYCVSQRLRHAVVHASIAIRLIVSDVSRANGRANGPAGASDDLVAFLSEGERALPVWEALEQRDLISRVLPEWAAVRCRPHHNMFHRFTVDRHLW